MGGNEANQTKNKVGNLHPPVFIHNDNKITVFFLKFP